MRLMIMLLQGIPFITLFLVTMLQILNLALNKSEIERRVHAVIDKFAERGLRSLAVAYQVRELLSRFHTSFF